jgi:hypothetical protein
MNRVERMGCAGIRNERLASLRECEAKKRDALSRAFLFTRNDEPIRDQAPYSTEDFPVVGWNVEAPRWRLLP